MWSVEIVDVEQRDIRRSVRLGGEPLEVQWRPAARSSAASMSCRQPRCVPQSKLAAFGPPPNFNMVRYAGIFANRHRLRDRISPTSTPPSPFQPPSSFEGRPFSSTHSSSFEQPKRIAWAKLLARVRVRHRRRGPAWRQRVDVEPMAARRSRPTLPKLTDAKQARVRYRQADVKRYLAA